MGDPVDPRYYVLWAGGATMGHRMEPTGTDELRELEVLQLIAEGLTNQEVATRLYLSLHTVKVHARNIFTKLAVKNRAQAVARGRALGILSQT